MTPHQPSLFPEQESLNFSGENAIVNTLFSDFILNERLPGRTVWRRFPVTADAGSMLRNLIREPLPQPLGFQVVQDSGTAPLIVKKTGAADPVAFLATDSVYKSHYSLVRFMSQAYINWGIATDGRIWRLFHGTAFSPSEHCYEVNLPLLLDHGSGDLRRFLMFFCPEAFAEKSGGRGFVDQLALETRKLRQAHAGDVALAAQDTALEFCRGFIHAEQAATGALPAGQGLLLIYRHALLLLYRILYLLYAEARGALPLHDARYRAVSLRDFIQRAADSKTALSASDPLKFNLWPQLAEIFDRAWRGDKALDATPQTCEFFNPDAHRFLHLNRVDDYHIQRAAARLFSACAAEPGAFAELSAPDLARALAPLTSTRLHIADKTLLLVNDGGVRRLLPSKKVKWMEILDRIGPGTAFLAPHPDPGVTRAEIDPDAERLFAQSQGAGAGLFDPFCGPGTTLLQGAAAMACVAAEQDPDTPLALHKRRVIESRILGADPNAFMAELARFALTLFALDPGLTPPAIQHRVRSGNILLALRMQDLDGEPALAEALAEIREHLGELATGARELPAMPATAYGEARRKHSVSRRITVRTVELAVIPDLAVERALTARPARTAPLVSDTLLQDQDRNRPKLSDAFMADPDDIADPLHPEWAFPDLFSGSGAPGFPRIASALPRKMALDAGIRSLLTRRTGSAAVMNVAAMALRVLPWFAAPGAVLELIVPASFPRTRQAAALKKALDENPAIRETMLPPGARAGRGKHPAVIRVVMAD